MSASGATGIQDLVAALRRGWMVVLGCALVAWAIAYSNASDATPVYQSDARLVVVPAKLGEARDVIDTSAGLERESLVTTLSEVITGTEMRGDASEDARLADLDLDAYAIESAALPLANVVTLSVRGPNAEGAQRLAVSLVEESSRYFETVYPIYQVDELDSPNRPSGSVAPNPARDGGLAAFGGAMLGVAVVIAAVGWRRRAEPVAAATGPDARAPELPRLVEVSRDEYALAAERAHEVADRTSAKPPPTEPAAAGR